MPGSQHAAQTGELLCVVLGSQHAAQTGELLCVVLGSQHAAQTGELLCVMLGSQHAAQTGELLCVVLGSQHAAQTGELLCVVLGSQHAAQTGEHPCVWCLAHDILHKQVSISVSGAWLTTAQGCHSKSLGIQDICFALFFFVLFLGGVWGVTVWPFLFCFVFVFLPHKF